MSKNNPYKVMCIIAAGFVFMVAVWQALHYVTLADQGRQAELTALLSRSKPFFAEYLAPMLGAALGAMFLSKRLSAGQTTGLLLGMTAFSGVILLFAGVWEGRAFPAARDNAAWLCDVLYRAAPYLFASFFVFTVSQNKKLYAAVSVFGMLIPTFIQLYFLFFVAGDKYRFANALTHYQGAIRLKLFLTAGLLIALMLVCRRPSVSEPRKGSDGSNSCFKTAAIMAVLLAAVYAFVYYMGRISIGGVQQRISFWQQQMSFVQNTLGMYVIPGLTMIFGGLFISRRLTALQFAICSLLTVLCVQLFCAPVSSALGHPMFSPSLLLRTPLNEINRLLWSVAGTVFIVFCVCFEAKEQRFARGISILSLIIANSFMICTLFRWFKLGQYMLWWATLVSMLMPFVLASICCGHGQKSVRKAP